MKERICKCGKKFLAKEADIKRGWAKSCSKSCAKKGNSNRYFKKRKIKRVRMTVEEYVDSRKDLDEIGKNDLYFDLTTSCMSGEALGQD